MTSGHDTLVFIPAWNEEGNLPAVLEELREELPAIDVLVVDDGSTDGTAEVGHSAGAGPPGSRPRRQSGRPSRALRH